MLLVFKVVVALAVFVAGMFAARLIWRAVKRGLVVLWDGIGSDARLNALALGAALVIMHSTVVTLVTFVVRACEVLFVYQPLAIVTSTNLGANGRDGGDVAEALQDLAQQTGDLIRRNVMEMNLPELPWGGVLVTLALWVIIYRVARRLATRSSSSGEHEMRVLYGNAGFIGILSFGLFLSFAAIVAVPVLQEPEITGNDTTSEKLDAQLRTTGATLQDESRYPKDLFPALAAVEAASTSPSSASDAGDAAATAGDRSIGPPSTPVSIQALVDIWHQLQTTAISVAQEERSQAVNAFRIESEGRKVTRGTISHIRELSAWYEHRIALHAKAMDTCLQAIRGLQHPMPADAALHARDKCTLVRNLAPPPGRHASGAELGLFTLLAEWLLAAESVPLALVVGMLGFGLLGAAISSFVRGCAEGTRHRPGALVDDLLGVVIKGMSAALVLFLGVEGGLGAFANKDAEPNPYVLFFACFTAAVFSERVWAWAYDKLVDAIGPSPGGAAAPEVVTSSSTSTPESAAPAAPAATESSK